MDAETKAIVSKIAATLQTIRNDCKDCTSRVDVAIGELRTMIDPDSVSSGGQT